MFTLNFWKLFIFAFDSADSASLDDRHSYYKTMDGATNVSETNAVLRIQAEGMLLTGLTNREDANNRIADAGVLDGLSTEADFLATTTYKGKYYGQTFNNNWTYGFRSRYPTFMILGRGTKKPEKTDYHLEDFIGTDILKCTDNTYSKNENFGDNTDEAMTCNWDFQNISNEAVQVNEVGLVSVGAETNNNYPKVLIFREVLATPVTIQPNEKYTFSVQVKF